MKGKGQMLTPLGDALRQAIKDSGLSYNELRRRAGVNQAQVSRFMVGDRDLTLQVAARICLVLGYELVRTGALMAEPLAEPPPSTRGRPAGPPPETADARGRGRRVDLEGKGPAEKGTGRAERDEKAGGKRRHSGKKGRAEK